MSLRLLGRAARAGAVAWCVFATGGEARGMYPGNPTAVSPRFFAHLEDLEGCELEAYPDPASPLGRAITKMGFHVREYRRVPKWEQLSGVPWTIALGSTDPAVYPGMRITRVECEARARHNVRTAVEVVNRLVTVPLTQNQFDALVLFVYNVGEGRPNRPGFKQSTLLKCLNKKNYADAAREFHKWRRAGGAVNEGLVIRRKKEAALFMTPDPTPDEKHEEV